MVLLARLKMSVRNSKYLASVIATFFDNVISHWFKPGPQQMERGVVEKVPSVESEY